jgi:hypothetical protein
MRELVVEILLRLSRVLAATVVGVLIYLVLTGPLAVAGPAQLALLAWLVGAAFVLLVETSPL